MFGNPETTTGWKRPEVLRSVRLDIHRIGQIKEAADDITGNRVRVKVVKNKVAPPFGWLNLIYHVTDAASQVR